MDNYQIADAFSLLAKVMEIHGENTFKIRSYSNAAFQIEKLNTPLAHMSSDEIAGVKGIGDAISTKIGDLLSTGKLPLLEQYLAKTPAGVLEMLHIKGIGPKKINTIWKEMEIESVGELLYACNENRLTLFKGFGAKTQQNVKESIEFYLGHQGLLLYQQAEQIVEEINARLLQHFSQFEFQVSGAFRRQAEIIERLEWVIEGNRSSIHAKLESIFGKDAGKVTDDHFEIQITGCPPLLMHAAEPGALGVCLVRTTGSDAFYNWIEPRLNGKTYQDETDIFQRVGLPFIPPYLREAREEWDSLKEFDMQSVIQVSDIRGIIHSHSTWSDGANNLSEMAEAAIQKGMEYLVISDHSKTAAYANGLSVDRVIQQHKEIDALNKTLAPFKIFKSIEADILNDGSLDYDGPILASFDLVIASVHSNLKMTQEKAMERLLKAIKNKYTTILGHPTGRLLLSRNGYPIDHKKVIDTCVEHRVAIELNAHPRRLDLDWRWIEYAIKKGAHISIDPDAHSIDGFEDVKYGVLVAQKAMLSPHQNLSSMTLSAFEAYLASVKS